MIKKTIHYTDIMGEKSEMVTYFHMNKAEVLKWMVPDGNLTLDQVLNKFLEHKNVKEMMLTIEDLIRRSYGEKSVDGKSFVKSAERTEAFMQTEAYSTLFMELINDDDKATEFLNGIFPAELTEEVNKMITEHPEMVPDELKDHLSVNK